jgi:hypothetical protein
MIRLNWSGLPQFMIEIFLKKIRGIRGIRGVSVLICPGVSPASNYTLSQALPCRSIDEYDSLVSFRVNP